MLLDYMIDRKLGEILVDKGLIESAQLESALNLQLNDNSILGKILIGENHLSHLDLHQTIAEKYGLDFVDLFQTILNFDIIKDDRHDDYFAHQLLPYAEGQDFVTLAVTNITDDIRGWASANYPDKEIKFVITSPNDIRHVLQMKFSSTHDMDARLKLWNQEPQYSAYELFKDKRNLTMLIMMAFCAMFALQAGFVAMVTVMNLLFFLAIGFKDVVFAMGQKKNVVMPLVEDELPVYTILLPLLEETETLPALIRAIEKLDYPKSKLDVKFVVEIDDNLTIDALKKLAPPPYMEILRVPLSLPKTKAKACNYALNFVRGEYVTIYDAEDIPDTKQLKEVLARFQNADEKLACVQARLNYFNYNDNQLTRWFALEYAIWFDSVMLGLERLKMSIPLGGTSNHVRTKILKKIGGWDAFNVTEDADLGMRLAQEGYCTATISSLTLEEAVITPGAWMGQRTRWIKGFVQTYFVHMRRSGHLIRTAGFGSFLSLQFFIGVPILIYLATPVLLVACFFLTFSWLWPPIYTLPKWLEIVCIFNLGFGLLSHAVICLVAERKNEFKQNLMLSCLTFSLYPLMHIWAAYRAVHELVTKPHYWNKTKHGKAKTRVGF